MSRMPMFGRAVARGALFVGQSWVLPCLVGAGHENDDGGGDGDDDDNDEEEREWLSGSKA